MTIDIFEIHKHLVKKSTGATLEWNKEEGEFYIDLNTRAKSHLYLSEKFILTGRYGFEKTLPINDESTIDSSIESLC